MDRQVLPEIELQARELLVQAVDARKVQALVERMLEQAVGVKPVVQELAQEVAPPDEEGVPPARREEPALGEVPALKPLRPVVRVEEDGCRLAPGGNLLPAEAVEVRAHDDVDVEPHSAIPGQQGQPHAVGRRLVRQQVREAVRQLRCGQVLEDGGLVQDTDIPMRVVVLPGGHTELEKVGHPIVALRPVGPYRPLPHLAGQASLRSRGGVVRHLEKAGEDVEAMLPAAVIHPPGWGPEPKWS
mmetsp:Transcript_108715/g.307497  ORF Transcript_108715/g.307497 Transcript_108715/m.307497 type:complete len:243 (-) Transcript_108715:7-735(-)